MQIYNIFPLLAGRVNGWETHLQRARDMEFTWIFVNPIQRPGSSGSLYSIQDYFAINPFLITENGTPPYEQIGAMNKTAHRIGLRVMVDLVIAHSAVDSPLIQEHPEWFVRDREGKPAHPFCYENGKKVTWRDLAKFDHTHTSDPEGLFQFFFRVVNQLIELGFSGFRCDAAYQVPAPVWERLIRETKRSNPDILFFAETLGCTAEQTRRTAKAGFDYIFNSSKWWDFNDRWLMNQYNLLRTLAPSVGFPESHDTVRLCKELNGNIAGLKQRYLFAAFFSSAVMIPMGFELGFRKKLHVVKTRPEDWEETDIDISSFIEKVNQMKGAYAIFREEAPMEVLHHDNPHILLMWKASATTDEEVLFIMNKDIHNKQHMYAENLHAFVQAGAPFSDVSPEYRLDYIPEPFSYDLRPGQGKILFTRRDG